MNRAEAAAAGMARYDSDRPCKHGHRPQRYTSTGICVQCAAANTAKNRHKHVVRSIAGKMGLVDLAGVRVRPGDIEAVMAVVDACNLMSGAPAANRPAMPAQVTRTQAPEGSVYADRLFALQDAYMRSLSPTAREALAEALRYYGEDGQHLPTPADEVQVQAVLALVDRYVTEFTAESLAAMKAAFARGPLPRAVDAGPLSGRIW